MDVARLPDPRVGWELWRVPLRQVQTVFLSNQVVFDGDSDDSSIDLSYRASMDFSFVVAVSGLRWAKRDRMTHS